MITKLLSRLRNAGSSMLVAAAERALVEARAGLEDARTIEARVTAEFQAAQLDPKVRDLREPKDRITAAELLRGQAEAIVALAEQRLEEARERQDQAGRQRLYLEAQAKSVQAQEAFAAYPAAAAQLVGLFRVIAAAEVAVQAANELLPDGAAELPSPEQSIRGLPAVPRTLLRKEIASDHWYYMDGRRAGHRVEEHKLSLIEATGRVGTLTEAGYARQDAKTFKVVKRRLEVSHYREHQPALVAAPLSAEISLPGLRPGDAPIWSPWGEPAGVIEAADALASAKRLPARDPRIPVEFSVNELLDAPNTAAQAAE